MKLLDANPVLDTVEERYIIVAVNTIPNTVKHLSIFLTEILESESIVIVGLILDFIEQEAIIQYMDFKDPCAELEEFILDTSSFYQTL